MSQHPSGHVITIWVLGNRFAVTTDCTAPWSHDHHLWPFLPASPESQREGFQGRSSQGGKAPTFMHPPRSSGFTLLDPCCISLPPAPLPRPSQHLPGIFGSFCTWQQPLTFPATYNFLSACPLIWLWEAGRKLPHLMTVRFNWHKQLGVQGLLSIKNAIVLYTTLLRDGNSGPNWHCKLSTTCVFSKTGARIQPI